MADREFTDADLDWTVVWMTERGWCITAEEATFLMRHGFRPPPRPRSIRDEVAEVLDCEAKEPPRNVKVAVDYADALLARFDIRRKGE